jgi:hypothetical protein
MDAWIAHISTNGSTWCNGRQKNVKCQAECEMMQQSKGFLIKTKAERLSRPDMCWELERNARGD